MRFTGTVDITITAANDTNRITLHAHKDLQVNVTGLREADTQIMVVTSAPSTDEKHQFLIIGVKNSLKATKKYVLSLSFQSDLRRDNYGFYVSSYAVADGFE